MKFIPTAFTILFLSAIPAHATDMAQWIVDPQKSTLRFSGDQGGKAFSGAFDKFTTDIIFSPDRLDQSHIKVTVDTASGHTGDKVYDGSLPGPEWFNASKFPQAVFETSSIKHVGSDKEGIENYEAAGKLTILGIEKPITLPFALKKDGANTRAYGEVVVKRLDFGLGSKPDSKAEWVSNDIRVTFDVTAHP